jgi:hypothetical protein
MIQISYDSSKSTFVTTVQIHSCSTVETRLYDAVEGKHGEFLHISLSDAQKKEHAELFITKDALDSFIEQMSVVCALRFKNKGNK